MKIPLGRGDYFRSIAKEARIRTVNRFFESNPVLTQDPNVSMIARPGLRRFMTVGSGPINGMYSQPGSFLDALFVLSDQDLYRVERDGSSTLIQAAVIAPKITSPLIAVATGTIGETPEYLFFTRGSTLYLYLQNGYALGTLTGTPANSDVVRLGDVYYQFTSGSVNAGTPAGTLANPWLVALGVSSLDAFQNLREATTGLGVPGTTYSTLLVANPAAQGVAATGGELRVRANAAGAAGNAIVTTETGAALAWGAGTLTGGGGPTVSPVQTPDDVGVIGLGYIGGYVIVAIAQGEGVNGRFYWIEPGETVIDPLNFATAERSPDPISGVVVFSDQFWLPGVNTTEVWYLTGNADAPVLRLQGITFDEGTVPGTATKVKDSMIIVDSDGGVFEVKAGSIEPIAPPDIQERIRLAVQRQNSGV